MFKRSWVRNPEPDTGWTFLIFICCKNCYVCLFEKTENKWKRSRVWPVFLNKHFHIVCKIIFLTLSYFRCMTSSTSARRTGCWSDGRRSGWRSTSSRGRSSGPRPCKCSLEGRPCCPGTLKYHSLYSKTSKRNRLLIGHCGLAGHCTQPCCWIRGQIIDI